jgi:acyl-coenzyme A thioesterase PaaI-like protein
LTSELREAQASPLARFEFEPHNCFACGSLNAHGLQLELHLEPGRSWTEFQLDRRFEGWEGVAHGGILCTILDEVMAWALIAEDNWGVTARMQVAFKRPVAVGTPIRADGWVTRSRRRLTETASRIVDAGTGAELATAEGTYFAADAAQKQRLRERYGFRFVRDGATSATGAADTHELVDEATVTDR